MRKKARGLLRAEIVTSNTPKEAALSCMKDIPGAVARRIPGEGWRVDYPDGRVVVYVDRTRWFRNG